MTANTFGARKGSAIRVIGDVCVHGRDTRYFSASPYGRSSSLFALRARQPHACDPDDTILIPRGETLTVIRTVAAPRGARSRSGLVVATRADGTAIYFERTDERFNLAD